MIFSDAMQFGLLLITAVGLIYTLYSTARSFQAQNKLMKAQLLKDRFDMYQMAGQSISDDIVNNFHVYYFEYMDTEMFDTKYKGRKDRIRKYIWLGDHYEALAFNYSLRDTFERDILDEEWIKAWLMDLKQHDEFSDVHQNYRKYFRKFAELVDKTSPGSSLKTPSRKAKDR